MIEIRIRRSWDATAVHLADVYDVDEIDTVLRSLKAWGIAESDDADVFGQWVVDDGAAYFEFVIEDDEP